MKDILAKLICYFIGHDWEHDGPGTWSQTCKRCDDYFRM